MLAICGMIEAMRVLLIEDDLSLARVLKRGLVAEGHAVDLAANANVALERAMRIAYDVITLDVMLPGEDGFSCCARLRDAEIWAPILMLTARDSVSDRIAGLDAGADDYLAKPFAFGELAARLRALARRTAPVRPVVLECGNLRLDPATLTAYRGAVPIALSSKEHALLEALIRRAGQVVSRQTLLEAAWDYGYEHRSNVVEVYVRYLRQKIDEPFSLKTIETIRGAGYRLRSVV